MTATDMIAERPASAAVEHFDVLIVGAGISGVGAAYHLQTQRPGTSFVVLESKDTFGYRFKPWTGAPIATAAEILSYMNEVIDENHLAQHIRYGHKIVDANWSSTDNLWTVDVARTDGTRAQFTTNFLFMCQGY